MAYENTPVSPGILRRKVAKLEAAKTTRWQKCDGPGDLRHESQGCKFFWPAFSVLSLRMERSGIGGPPRTEGKKVEERKAVRLNSGRFAQSAKRLWADQVTFGGCLQHPFQTIAALALLDKFEQPVFSRSRK